MNLDLILGAAKNLVRTGWMLRGVPASAGENIAEHSWEASILALVLGYMLKDRGLRINPEKAAAIAIIHDIAETVMGDIPRWSSEKMGNTRDTLEREAFNELKLPEGLHTLIYEGLEQKTIEAKLAKVCDYLSTYLQARRYVRNGYIHVEEIAENMRKILFKLAGEIPGLLEVTNKLGLGI